MAQRIIWLLRGFIALLDYRKWGVFQEIYKESKFNGAINPSWSQAGEDISIDLFLSKDNSSKFYLDIGAHDPNRFSVTRKLYSKGWSGIDIDANPSYEIRFNKFRTRNRFMNLCVGSQAEYKFTIFTEGAISSANGEWVKKFSSEGAVVKEVITVPGMKLRDILDLPNVPKQVDFINIDVEGADEDALRSLELESLPIGRYPRWILLETTPPVQSALDFPSVRYALENGYIPWLILPMATLLKSP
jgi:FkbM family methyltransferase